MKAMKESYPAKVTCGSSTARTIFSGLPSGEPVADGAISRSIGLADR